MSKIISNCPCCNSILSITALQCPDCGIELRNTFELSPFDRLDAEQRTFLLSFLKARGNLKNLQEDLYISYPTAKKRLDDLLCALDLSEDTNDITIQEIPDMLNINVNRNSIKASDIIKAKLIDNGGRITVYTAKGLPCDVWINADGKSFTSNKLPIKPPYKFQIFDVIVELLLSQGGNARKGNGRNYRLGEKNCDINTVVGAVAIDRGNKPGDSVFDPVFVFAAILEWAGIAHNGRGELTLTHQYRSKL